MGTCEGRKGVGLNIEPRTHPLHTGSSSLRDQCTLSSRWRAHFCWRTAFAGKQNFMLLQQDKHRCMAQDDEVHHRSNLANCD